MRNRGLILHRGGDAAALADDLVRLLSVPGDDPFRRPLVLTPGPGMQRWLSQRVASGGVADREGICAGLDLQPLASLERLLSDRRHQEDDWAPERLVWRILDAADADDDPALSPLVTHLAANEQRYANALRVARLFAGYADHRPALLSGWLRRDEGAEARLGFDAWQPVLWRRLHASIDAPDPVTRRVALAEGLRSGARAVPWPSALVFAARRVRPGQAALLAALATRIPVDGWLGTAGPAATGNELAVQLGRRGQESAHVLADVADEVEDLAAPSRPDTVLGWLQSDLDAGSPVRLRVGATADGSVRIHASHGPDRQAEVLREVLTGLLADDPTLEPRDIVVTCPDVAALAPHLAAVFGPDPAAAEHLTSWRHPAGTFRVQLSDRSAADTNLLYALLRDILRLGSSRATAAQLLGLCGHPFVGRRFGLSAEDVERLEQLIPAASVRWGLNPAHRALFGLGTIAQNTWQVGVQRLMMGEAFSDDRLVSAGVIATVDDVASTDTVLLGALAELVSRTSRLVARCAAPGTVAEWVARFRLMIEQLTDVPFEESWQIGQVWSVLDAVERRGELCPTALGAADALALIDDEFARRSARPAFGNGSLVVCGLDALAQVPHRVVCLVGLDDRTFPRRRIPDGDNLVAAEPCPGDPDPGLDDRQSLLDALTAARDALVVIYQGRSSLTNEAFPPPAGVVDLLEAMEQATGLPADLLVRREALQPFGPANFGAPPRSFDKVALGAATALTGPRRPAPERYEVGRLPLAAGGDRLSLDQLTAFFRHPARFLLRQRAGLTIGDEEPPTERLPLELSPLERWAVGDRMVRALLEGHPLEAVVRAEWLRGEVPPRALGQRELNQVAANAAQIVEEFSPFAAVAPQTHPVDLRLGGYRLTGRVATRGDDTVACRYSRVSATHLAEGWLRALAVTATLDRPVGAVLLGHRGRVTLGAVNPDSARALLEQAMDVARHGLERVLPLPPRTALRWARCRLRNVDPLADRRGLWDDWRWERDDVWDLYVPKGRAPWEQPLGDGDPWPQDGSRSLLGALAARLWEPLARAER